MVLVAEESVADLYEDPRISLQPSNFSIPGGHHTALLHANRLVAVLGDNLGTSTAG